jgi:23S rRNA (guanosine2251-2'-O)-methyltransferase
MFAMRKLSLHELNRHTAAAHRDAPKIPVIIILDNLRSQHNIGSVFRTADAFRLEAIYLCGITATPPSREMRKTALGATESVPWKYFQETMQAVDEVREMGYQICSVEQTEGSISIDQFEPTDEKGMGVVFGNEVEGVGQSIIDKSDCCIEIPQYGTKHSLNVAVSVGILSWEILCKFLKRKPGILG